MFENIFESVYVDLITNVVTAAIVTSFALSTRLKMILFKTINAIRYSNKKLVIVWVDDDDVYTADNIIESLDARVPGFTYILLKEPRDILRYKLNQHIAMIMFFVTDVTKLNAVRDVNTKIQSEILKYVQEGGCFLGTHDLLYRRTNSKKFQAAFGCKITKFKTFDKPIRYKVADEFLNHPLVECLPMSFELEDNEVCWGDWDTTVKKVLVLEDNAFAPSAIPLFTYKEYHKGKLYWINSGDKNDDGLPKSLKKPDNTLMVLLSNILKYGRENFTDIRQKTNSNDISANRQEIVEEAS